MLRMHAVYVMIYILGYIAKVPSFRLSLSSACSMKGESLHDAGGPQAALSPVETCGCDHCGGSMLFETL